MVYVSLSLFVCTLQKSLIIVLCMVSLLGMPGSFLSQAHVRSRRLRYLSLAIVP